jgi:tRNA dimethylallyltransferase
MKLLALVGPTASGKTALALDLAEHFPIEIVSMDSMAIYRYLPITTAQPDAATLARFPHHLMNCLELNEEFSVASWLKMCKDCLEVIRDRGKVPLLVGGTFLYLKALREGLHPMPGKDPRVRQEHREIFEKEGAECLWKQLKKRDSQAAEKIHPHDFKRVSRALEIIELSQKTLSRTKKEPVENLDMDCFCLSPKREFLYERINKRVDAMMERGFLDEIKAIVDRPLAANLQEAIGLREGLAHLRGEVDFETMCERVKQRTRHLAKHQFTWMRRFDFLQVAPCSEGLFDPIAEKLKVQHGG